jgi:hypothetical protein
MYSGPNNILIRQNQVSLANLTADINYWTEFTFSEGTAHHLCVDDGLNDIILAI